MGYAAYSRLVLGIGSATVKLIFTPISAGIVAARHLAWYVSYQVTGEARVSDPS
jgi:hypothetical protein